MEGSSVADKGGDVALAASRHKAVSKAAAAVAVAHTAGPASEGAVSHLGSDVDVAAEVWNRIREIVQSGHQISAIMAFR